MSFITPLEPLNYKTRNKSRKFRFPTYYPHTANDSGSIRIFQHKLDNKDLAIWMLYPFRLHSSNGDKQRIAQNIGIFGLQAQRGSKYPGLMPADLVFWI